LPLPVLWFVIPAAKRRNLPVAVVCSLAVSPREVEESAVAVHVVFGFVIRSEAEESAVVVAVVCSFACHSRIPTANP